MNPSLTVHIISFDIPYPAHYGGVIDVYYKIKSLHQSGVKIILHCFYKELHKESKLEELCHEVHYYPRKNGVISFLHFRPFIVQSRISKKLFKRLLQDEYPILMEGLHTSYYLKLDRKNHRKVFVRTHNIEHEYYRFLAQKESHFLKKLYYIFEAMKQKRYEKTLHQATALFAISSQEKQYFKTTFPTLDTHLLPAFHGCTAPQHTPEEYALYHADVTINDNIQWAKFLIKVFSNTNYPLVIAGKMKDKQLFADLPDTIRIVPNPDDESMQNLIEKAKIHCLFTDNSSGMKLKLIKSMYTHGYCLANSAMVEGTGLEPFCMMAETQEEIEDLLISAISLPISHTLFDTRKSYLDEHLNDVHNAQKWIQIVENYGC